MESDPRAMKIHKSSLTASRKKNYIWIVLLIISGMSNPILSYAGASLSDPLEKNVPVTKKLTTPIGTAVTGAGNVTPIVVVASGAQKMNCWQYGKLILEQTVIAPKDKITDMRMLHNPETGEQMMLFDFKTAFCIIK